MRKLRKGQYSIEYIFSVAMFLVILLAFFVVYWHYHNTSMKEIRVATVKSLGKELVDNLHAISGAGGLALKKVPLGNHEYLNSITVHDGRFLAINYTSTSGEETEVFSLNMTVGDLLAGTLAAHVYVVRAQSGAVVLCSESNCTCRGNTSCCTSGRCGIGNCRYGQHECYGSGRMICIGEVLPQPEIPANIIDEDCDNVLG
jgi:hypothetical protein